MGRAEDLARIHEALDEALQVLSRFTPGAVAYREKGDAGPVTEADLQVDALLRDRLPTSGEGWLSEESTDDPARLSCRRVWVVDPIDGTREFVDGIPEWVVSIGLVEDGRAVAGGIVNPQTDLRLVGSLETGVELNGVPCATRATHALEGADIVVSRSETARGEWPSTDTRPFVPRAVGSVAHKLALVAAGRADATWTVKPKSEWDVCAGVALVTAAGGRCWIPQGLSGATDALAEPEEVCFNRPDTRLPGLCAAPSALTSAIRAYLQGHGPSSRRT